MSHPVIMNQPQIVTVQRSDWQTGLFDCCDDCGVCLCGIFCPLCLGCQIASDMDECCFFGSSMAMRSVYRTKYGIPGSLLGDFCAVMCCGLCATCQLKRDINKRRDMGMF
uniref:Placenta-specific gene 8 protein-like n=1 Tax=Pogona vitticeps TaxID=103695 RepID=A0ABM5GKJ3_9SAUR